MQDTFKHEDHCKLRCVITSCVRVQEQTATVIQNCNRIKNCNKYYKSRQYNVLSDTNTIGYRTPV